ncbi:hypothetical protein EJ08DRAFT_730892 [Tothia fuscella]|uniref:Mid2 domain-containing protein n=1 Tax=Tothia fuscella TaxID=1048955 RepID=A0A9P4U115_9PEZI|nr:hypothetical protein EJ08DRAFT_730892 [Tothia fuscella]
MALQYLSLASLLVSSRLAHAALKPELTIPENPRTCYWPSGKAVSDNQTELYHYTPCFDGDSHCCAIGEVCLTNGLCYGAVEGQNYRGACTDSTWRTANCPTFCSDSFPDSWANIMPCEMNEVGQWQWWCGHYEQTKWCTAGRNASLLAYPRGDVVKILGVTSNATNTTSNSTNIIPSTLPTNDSCAAIPELKASKNKTVVGVAVGIGAPLLIAIGALAFMFMKERKKTQNLRDILDEQLRYQNENKVLYTGDGYGPGELPANFIYELGETGRMPELDVKRATLRAPEIVATSLPATP